MFRKILISFVILFLAFVSSSLATEPFWGTVKKIIDGDSLVIASGKTM
jgi:hypothetical protein